MQSEIDSLREVNSKLLTEITELRKENVEVKTENAKLKHALEEHEARFANLEQRDKEKTNLIAKLDDDIKEIKQEQIANTCIPKSPINSELQVTSRSSVSPSQSLDTSSIGVLLKQAVDISSSDTDQSVNANPARSCMSEQKSF